MMPVVQKNIGDGVLGFAWGAKCPRVVAFVEYASLAAGDAIEPPRDPDLHCADAAPQRTLVVGLDDEVDVAALEREVDDTKVPSGLVRAAKRLFERAKLQLRP